MNLLEKEALMRERKITAKTKKSGIPIGKELAKKVQKLRQKYCPLLVPVEGDYVTYHGDKIEITMEICGKERVIVGTVLMEDDEYIYIRTDDDKLMRINPFRIEWITVLDFADKELMDFEEEFSEYKEEYQRQKGNEATG